MPDITLDQPDQIAFARILALKGMLKLEMAGMTRRGRSAYSIIKEELGYKGNRRAVYLQLKRDCTKALYSPAPPLPLESVEECRYGGAHNLHPIGPEFTDDFGVTRVQKTCTWCGDILNITVEGDSDGQS